MFTDPKPALEFIIEHNQADSDKCFVLPFSQKRVFYLNKQNTPQRVACIVKNGPPEIGQVPVRECPTLGCVNGKHIRWGRQSEANKKRIMPDQKGQNNPGAKLTDLDVAQLRCIKWWGGYHKKQAADALGISMKTLALVINGHSWKGIMPYQGAAEWASRNNDGDEF